LSSHDDFAWADVRCVLFDAVGTLICPHPPVSQAYWHVARRYGSSLAEPEVHARFRRAFARRESADAGPSGCRTDELHELERWQTIVAEVLDDVSDSAAAFDDLWRHFGMPASWRLFDDVADTWRRLAARRLRLGIASNFDRRLRQVCGGLPPLDECEDLFVSSELGFRKPSPDFFRIVEERLRLSGDQIVLVGDDWENDFVAARQAGWQAMFLDRLGERPRAKGCLQTLRELG
jgi:putative hydrolase of the HAD superfamily